MTANQNILILISFSWFEATAKGALITIKSNSRWRVLLQKIHKKTPALESLFQ